jgi:shikimate kinase
VDVTTEQPGMIAHETETDQHPAAFVLTRPIVMVGMMGCGKTTVGRRLATRLGVPFVDADEEIQAAASLSIPEIFTKLGEAAFRDGERRVIARLMTDTPQVVATGGGAFVNEDTRKLILDKAIAIWLQAPLDVLVERTGRRNNRPLLQNGDPATILGNLLELREPFYAQAPIHVTSGRQPHERTVDAILSVLSSGSITI